MPEGALLWSRSTCVIRLHHRPRNCAISFSVLLTLIIAPFLYAQEAVSPDSVPPIEEWLSPRSPQPPAHLAPPRHILRDSSSTLSAQQPYQNPFRQAVHRINQLSLAVTNSGVLGTLSMVNQPIDYFINRDIRRNCEYPRKSYREYMTNIDLWVGAQLRRDIGVSTGLSGSWWADYAMKFLPVDFPGTITARSTAELYGGPHDDAVSEEDFICEYTDSMMILSYYDGYTIVPNTDALKIKVRQESHAWSYLYAEDIVFFELMLENVGSELLRDVYIGLHVVPNVHYSSNNLCRDDGEIVGLRRTAEAPFGCGYRDTLDIAWFADNDGDPWEEEFAERPGMWLPPDAFQTCTYASIRGAVGIVPLETPSSSPLNFNWWTSGFDYYNDSWYLYEVEPSLDPNFPALSREQWDWGANLSTKRQYRRLGTAEKDYTSYLASVISSSVHSEPWQPIPWHMANSIASGMSADVLLSWGPFTMWPGAQIPLSFAVVGGQNFHTEPKNNINLPLWPSWFEKLLDFSDLEKNARWAQWIFDNPGYDTDGDGYLGEFRICVRDSAIVNGEWVVQKADTQWYKGDGIPDLRAAQEPTSPRFWLTPVRDGIHVRINGGLCETERDVFLQRPDFEGYRIYLGRDEREESLAMIGSYDVRNYDKFIRITPGAEPVWISAGVPFTLEELRCLYGSGPEPCQDSAFDPLDYTVMTPYHHPRFPNDSVFRFDPHGHNTAGSPQANSIRKIYPEMPDPRTLPADDITPDMYTEEGLLKFYEYEFTIEELLPTVPYYVSVTAYDFGSPEAGLYPLESNKTADLQGVYPLAEWDDPMGVNGKVYVYPNPYLIDADYRDLGLEGRGHEDRWRERVRAIWFANLPPKCTIHIYSLDGDRIRTLEHDVDPSNPEHKREMWGLINRNQQVVETGLYYFVVEIPGGVTQVGKFAILR